MQLTASSTDCYIDLATLSNAVGSSPSVSAPSTPRTPNKAGKKDCLKRLKAEVRSLVCGFNSSSEGLDYLDTVLASLGRFNDHHHAELPLSHPEISKLSIVAFSVAIGQRFEVWRPSTLHPFDIHIGCDELRHRGTRRLCMAGNRKYQFARRWWRLSSYSRAFKRTRRASIYTSTDDDRYWVFLLFVGNNHLPPKNAGNHQESHDGEDKFVVHSIPTHARQIGATKKAQDSNVFAESCDIDGLKMKFRTDIVMFMYHLIRSFSGFVYRSISLSDVWSDYTENWAFPVSWPQTCLPSPSFSSCFSTFMQRLACLNALFTQTQDGTWRCNNISSYRTRILDISNSFWRRRSAFRFSCTMKWTFESKPLSLQVCLSPKILISKLDYGNTCTNPRPMTINSSSASSTTTKVSVIRLAEHHKTTRKWWCWSNSAYLHAEWRDEDWACPLTSEPLTALRPIEIRIPNVYTIEYLHVDSSK